MSASIELREQVRARYAQAGIAAASLPREVMEVSLGCGNPTMVAEAGFTGVSVEFTHEAADGMHAAIIRATKPAH